MIQLTSYSRRIFSFIMLGITLIFYLFFAFYDGAVICVDSPSYITMNLSREPLYPLLLAAFRTVFSRDGGEFYLTVVAFFQSILAAFAGWSLADYIYRKFRLPKVIALGVLFMPMAVSLLCRFAAKRGSMYSNSILTEGIAISMYLLFFRYLLEYWFENTRKSLIICVLLSFLMFSTRKQMAIALAMLAVSVLVLNFWKKTWKKGIGITVAAAVLVLGGSVLFDWGFNLALRGDVVSHSSDGRFVTTMAFYTADRSDAEAFEDEEIGQLFLEIYDVCDAAGYLKHSAGEGWLNRVSHFGDHYDHIQIDTMWPMINDYVREKYGDGEVEVNVKADEVMSVMNRTVVPLHLDRILGCFIDNFISGLITTVAQRNTILNWYSLFIYLFYLGMLVWNVLLLKKQSGPDRILTGMTVTIAGLTALSICFNVGLVSLVIFCQTRYTIYNMAQFYISLILMMYNGVMKQRYH